MFSRLIINIFISFLIKYTVIKNVTLCLTLIIIYKLHYHHAGVLLKDRHKDIMKFTAKVDLILKS